MLVLLLVPPGTWRAAPGYVEAAAIIGGGIQLDSEIGVCCLEGKGPLFNSGRGTYPEDFARCTRVPGYPDRNPMPSLGTGCRANSLSLSTSSTTVRARLCQAHSLAHRVVTMQGPSNLDSFNLNQNGPGSAGCHSTLRLARI
eukprot:2853806-Rhodomonas_salina.3